MQMSAKKVDFQFAERSLFYAKMMQVGAKKTCFPFAQCNLFYAKLHLLACKTIICNLILPTDINRYTRLCRMELA